MSFGVVLMGEGLGEEVEDMVEDKTAKMVSTTVDEVELEDALSGTHVVYTTSVLNSVEMRPDFAS